MCVSLHLSVAFLVIGSVVLRDVCLLVAFLVMPYSPVSAVLCDVCISVAFLVITRCIPITSGIFSDKMGIAKKLKSTSSSKFLSTTAYE